MTYPLTFTVSFGDETAQEAHGQSAGCFPTSHATICSAATKTSAVKDGSDDEGSCPCVKTSGGDSPIKGIGDDEGCLDDLHGGHQDAPRHHN